MQVALAWLLQRSPNILLIPGHLVGRAPARERGRRRARPVRAGSRPARVDRALITAVGAYAGEVATEDPRPLTSEPLPLDLLNTTWVTDDGPRDLLADERGTRRGSTATGSPRRRPIPARCGRHARRCGALLLDRNAVAGVNAVLARGGERPVLRAGRTRPSAPWTRCRSGACRGRAPRSWSRCWRPADRRAGLREPRVRPLVPRHVTPRHPPLVLDGLVRQPRQSRAPRPHPSPLTCGIPVKTVYGGEHERYRHHVRHRPRRPQRHRPRAQRRLLTRVFGWSERGRGEGYAFLGDDARLIVTLWQQASGTFSTQAPGLHHLSFEVDSVEAVRATEARVREAGLRLYHDGIVPHGEGASSGRHLLRGPRRRPPRGLHRRRRPRRSALPAPPRPAASSRPVAWHAGELAVQRRAGVTDLPLRRRVRRCPPVARAFLTAQPWIALGTEDADGHLGEPALRRARLHHDAEPGRRARRRDATARRPLTERA